MTDHGITFWHQLSGNLNGGNKAINTGSCNQVIYFELTKELKFQNSHSESIDFFSMSSDYLGNLKMCMIFLCILINDLNSFLSLFNDFFIENFVSNREAWLMHFCFRQWDHFTVMIFWGFQLNSYSCLC